MKIVVLDGYTINPGDNPWDDVAKHGEFVCHDRTPANLILERAKDADILLTNKTLLIGRHACQIAQTEIHQRAGHRL